MVRFSHASGTPGTEGDTPVRRPDVVARCVARGDVHAGHRRQAAQQVVAAPARCPPRPDGLGQVSHRLLAVAEDEGVDEVGQGLGVEGAMTSGHDQGVRHVASALRTGTPARSTRLSTLV